MIYIIPNFFNFIIKCICNISYVTVCQINCHRILYQQHIGLRMLDVN